MISKGIRRMGMMETADGSLSSVNFGVSDADQGLELLQRTSDVSLKRTPSLATDAFKQPGILTYQVLLDGDILIRQDITSGVIL